MGSVIAWEEPEESRGRSSPLEPYLKELKENPGKWGLVHHGPNRGSRVGLTAYGCEVSTRKQPDGRFKVYARWPK